MSSIPFVSLASMILLLPQTNGSTRKPPKRPDTPFKVYVFAEPRGEPEVEKKILRASEELAKGLHRRGEWFLTIADRDAAEIVVEVQALLANDETREQTQTLTDGGRTHTTNYLFARERYYLIARANLFGNVTELHGSKGLNNELDAASALAKELQTYVKKNYWYLADRRELFREVSGNVSIEEVGRAWIGHEISRRVGSVGSEVQEAEWSGATLSLVIDGDEFRFPFPESGFDRCSRDMECQGKIVDQVMGLLEEPLKKKKAR